MVKIRHIEAKHFMTKTLLGGHDFTCNGYVGCEHGCLYCYASTMPSAASRIEAWGSYVDIREYSNLDIPKNTGMKSLFFSSMTDAYQPLEASVKRTRTILESIYESNLRISILTKSDLVLRDIDLLTKMRSVEVGFSIALKDEDATLFEPRASLPSKRILALKTLKSAGIRTFVFVSPIIPYITDVFSILEAIKDDVDYVMFDSLNLKDLANERRIFSIVEQRYPHLYESYRQIFLSKSNHFYEELRTQISCYMQENHLTCEYMY